MRNAGRITISRTNVMSYHLSEIDMGRDCREEWRCREAAHQRAVKDRIGNASGGQIAEKAELDNCVDKG